MKILPFIRVTPSQSCQELKPFISIAKSTGFSGKDLAYYTRLFLLVAVPISIGIMLSSTLLERISRTRYSNINDTPSFKLIHILIEEDFQIASEICPTIFEDFTEKERYI
jgi:hypothetical protein